MHTCLLVGKGKGCRRPCKEVQSGMAWLAGTLQGFGWCRRAAHPGGRCTTTWNTVGLLSTGVIGTVSTHLVKEPQRWTCSR